MEICPERVKQGSQLKGSEKWVAPWKTEVVSEKRQREEEIYREERERKKKKKTQAALVKV